MDDNFPISVAEDGRISPTVFQSRDHLEAILQAVTDGVLVHAPDGRIAYANAAAAQMFGAASPAALLASNVHDLIAPYMMVDNLGSSLTVDDLPGRSVLAGAAPHRRTIVLHERATGRERWWNINAAPIREVGTNAAFAVSILRDITERMHDMRENARLAAIVASADNAVIGKTLGGIITNWNPAAEQMYGYSAEEAIGQPIAMVVPEDRLAELGEIMARLRRGERLEPFDSVRVRRDGTRLDVALTISPILDRDGHVIGASTIARDITENVRIDMARQLLAEASSVLTSSLDLDVVLHGVANLLVPRVADFCTVHLIDDTGLHTQLALVQADPLQGPHVEALQGRLGLLDSDHGGIALATRTGEPILYREITEELLQRGSTSPEHLTTLRELGLRSAIVVPMMARSRAVGGVSVAFAGSGRFYDDTTIALVIEIVGRMAVAVDNSRLFADAQMAARAREEFLLTASHELRTPLTSIKASAQIISRYLEQPAPDLARIGSMLDRLQSEIGRLETLSCDLIDSATIQRGRVELHLEDCDLAVITGRVLSALGQSSLRLDSHQITFVAGEPVEGHWDAQRLSQVVGNLISNALKYSPEGGTVSVRVWSEGDEAMLLVEDEGIGIDGVEASKLFQPFERGTAVRLSTNGVGLGLYISHSIVNAHGGTIAVSSTPGQGSRFTVRLPLGPPE